jgi:hypothetical protein
MTKREEDQLFKQLGITRREFGQWARQIEVDRWAHMNRLRKLLRTPKPEVAHGVQ